MKGWADAVWLQGKRFGTVGLLKDGRTLRDHHAPGRGLRARLAQARRVVRRLHRGRPVAPRLHRERHGPAAPRPRARRPFRRAGRLWPPTGCARPLSAEVSFADDPLRMLRAARFIAGFGLEPVPEIPAAIKAMHDRLSIVSAERIRDELDKLVSVDETVAGPVVHRRDGPGGRVPPRAAGARSRAGPHPPPQRRPRPHPGRGGQDGPGPPAAAGRPAPRHRQARAPASSARVG